MVPLVNPMAIGSRIGANTAFSAAVTNAFGPRALSGLGQTEQQIYSRAKAAVAEYDRLVYRAAEEIPEVEGYKVFARRFLGDPSDPESGTWFRNAVEERVRVAESQVPTNYDVFTPGYVRHRIATLEGFVRDMEATLAAPDTLAVGLPSWVLPAAGVAAAGLLLLALFSE
jgi:hypothetical protein